MPISISRGEPALVGWPNRLEVKAPLMSSKFTRLNTLEILANTLSRPRRGKLFHGSTSISSTDPGETVWPPKVGKSTEVKTSPSGRVIQIEHFGIAAILCSLCATFKELSYRTQWLKFQSIYHEATSTSPEDSYWPAALYRCRVH